jgi:HD-GYP domain-containing protein (c-di-GMP phosphodiesterase class II)
MKRRLNLDSPQFKQKLIRTIIENTPVCYGLIDDSFSVLFTNQRYMQLRKIKEKKILGKKCYVVVNDGVPCAECAVREAMETGQPQEILRKDVLSDGTINYISDLAIPIQEEKTGDYEYIVEIMTDRTKEVKAQEQTDALFLRIVDWMIKMLEKKDPFTSQHSRDVSIISSKLTWYLGLSPKAVFNATLGGLLHDLGKLHVPDHILSKTEKLDEVELSVIKEHPMFTYLLFPPTENFRAIRDISISHHERWDGKGYPLGLKGEDIPIEARIAAIADTYDAMTSARPYRTGASHEEAIREIKNGSGTQFDPYLVEKFIQMIEDYGLDKEYLLSPDESTKVGQKIHTNNYVQRDIVMAPDNPERKDEKRSDGNIGELDTTESFTNAIFDNTPAYYVIVDDEFNLLYASKKFTYMLDKPINKIIGEKCWEAVNKKIVECFQDHDRPSCPVSRALETNEFHEGILEYHSHGQNIYFNSYAMPIELEDTNGEPFKCCLGILFDVTKEKEIQYNFEEDLKHIISILYNLVAEMEVADSPKTNEILEEAKNFNDYLNIVKNQLETSQ